MFFFVAVHDLLIPMLSNHKTYQQVLVSSFGFRHGIVLLVDGEVPFEDDVSKELLKNVTKVMVFVPCIKLKL